MNGMAMIEDRHHAGGLGQTTLDLVADLSPLTSPGAVGLRFQRFAEQLGFTSVACFKVPDPGEPLEQCMHMSTRPQAWIDRYIDQGYVRVDPLVQEVFRATGPFRWDDIMRRPAADPVVDQIRSERAEFGLHDGLNIPIYESKGYAGLVSLAGEAEVTSEVKSTLTVASVFLHNRLVTLRREKLLPDDLLTAREIECITWAAEGKSDWEIGQILRISSKTVNYHIENTKRKFGVPTRVQAIVYAFRYGKLG
jgi:LuxR family transcriptional regulator, quorum-sensing system regulator BjaR1